MYSLNNTHILRWKLSLCQIVIFISVSISSQHTQCLHISSSTKIMIFYIHTNIICQNNHTLELSKTEIAVIYYIFLWSVAVAYPWNSEVLTKLSRIPSSMEYKFITTKSEYGFHSFANWVESLTRGLLPPDHHSLCPLPSTEFVELFHEKNSWIRYWSVVIAAFLIGLWIKT
jgi:hypothetical protein